MPLTARRTPSVIDRKNERSLDVVAPDHGLLDGAFSAAALSTMGRNGRCDGLDA